MKMKRLKGFTLMELLVVLAIIGVLAAVLAPTMITYYRKAQLKDANAEARMVYNAVQTEMQRCIGIDRVIKDEDDKSLFNKTVMVAYNRNGTVTYSTVESSALVVPAAGSEDEADCLALVEAVHRLVSDSETYNWAVYVDNYIVKASISAPNNTSMFVGECSANGTIALEMSSVPYERLLPGPGVTTNELVRLAHSVYGD